MDLCGLGVGVQRQHKGIVSIGAWHGVRYARRRRDSGRGAYEPAGGQLESGPTRGRRGRAPRVLRIEGVLFHSPMNTGEALEALLVLPHGGPDSVTTRSFSSWSHYFAARGLSVLRPNYRGGLGYGFDFYAANRGRLGTIEFMDIEAVDLTANGQLTPIDCFTAAGRGVGTSPRGRSATPNDTEPRSPAPRSWIR